ncbi:hypothetical protein pb186bvf_012526 [Paramecium bursaria]
MSQIVKAVLALSKASAAAEWSALEAQIQPSLLKPTEISEIAVHFGKNQQGSFEFWNQVHETSAKRINDFNGEELGKLVYGMMSHEHEVDETHGQIISERMEEFYDEYLPEVETKNPNWLSDTTKKLAASLQIPFIPTLIQIYKEKIITKNQHPIYEQERRAENKDDSESEDEDFDRRPTPDWAVEIVENIQQEYIHANIDQRKIRQFVEEKVEEMESSLNQLK